VTHPDKVSIGIVGGGLAGLAAATALAEEDVSIQLFEARRHLGGRAGSFRIDGNGPPVDHCQHVAMACCTNFLDFCRRTGVSGHFRREQQLHFFGPDQRRVDLRPPRWLPAPLHLAPFLSRLHYLTYRERWSVARALWRLARHRSQESESSPSMGQWLTAAGQSRQAQERFWNVVLVSALGESLDRASVAAARKVFVDGFMANRQAYQIDVPTLSLGELYDEHVARHLQSRDVTLHRETAVRQIQLTPEALALELADGSRQCFDLLILAAPWRRVESLLAEDLHARLPEVHGWSEMPSSPITGVHLWFDRPLTDLTHAILVGHLSQWVFNHGGRPTGDKPQEGYYYQVVISASRDLPMLGREDLVSRIVDELRAIWPEATQASMLRSQVVTQRDAVFSYTPGLDRRRPAQGTTVPGLILAGDWTRTAWPATMEGAVRSGYLAAEAVLRRTGRPRRLLVADLPPSWLARLLFSPTPISN
jgi:squalene-associated FAD-dependent desaturase